MNLGVFPPPRVLDRDIFRVDFGCPTLPPRPLSLVSQTHTEPGVLRWIMLASALTRSEERHRFNQEVGDPELVYRRYFDQIYRYCRQRVNSDADAEDVCAQVFAEAITSLPKLSWQGKPVVALLYTIAGRRLIDLRRRSGDSTVNIDAVEEPKNQAPSLDVLVQHGAIGQAIDALPEDQRLCVYLQTVQGLAFAEVAQIVGRSEKACKGLVYRGLESVRKSLAEQGLAP